MEQKNHTLELTDRNKLSLTGISGIDNMTDSYVTVNLADTKLIVKGGGLNVNLLNVEEGKLVIVGGVINGMEYTSTGKKEKFSFGKLFK